MGALISANQWGRGGSGGLSSARGNRSKYQWAGSVTMLITVIECLSSHRNSSVPSLLEEGKGVIPETVSTMDSYLTARVIQLYVTGVFKPVL